MSTAPEPTDLLPDAERDAQTQAGIAALNGIYSLVRALRLYDANNAAIARIVAELSAAAVPWLATAPGGLRLTVLTDQAFVDERLIKADPTLYERITALHERLEPLGINEIHLRQGLSDADLLALTEALAVHTRGQGSRLQDPGTDRIAVRWVEGDAVAAYRLPPDRLAVWLYASLLDLTEQLYERARTGETPSLVPIRRALQLLVDHLPGNQGVFQLLAMLRDPSPPSKANRRVLVAIELVCFGQWLGLPPRELLPLGLAGVLGGLALGTDVDRPVQALLRFSGLGEIAMPVALVLHDAVAARTGGEAGPAGRALAMIEAWSMLVAGSEGAPPRAPVVVNQALASGQPAWVGRELGAAYAAFLGRWPLGSLVRLDDDATAVVVSRPHDERPVVLRVRPDGGAGERLDLAQHPERRILGPVEPARAQVHLTRLVREGVEEEEAQDLDPEVLARRERARQREAERRRGRERQAPLEAPAGDELDFRVAETEELPLVPEAEESQPQAHEPGGLPVITRATLQAVGVGPRGPEAPGAGPDRIEDMEEVGLDDLYGVQGGLDEAAVQAPRSAEVTGWTLLDEEVEEEHSEVIDIVVESPAPGGPGGWAPHGPPPVDEEEDPDDVPTDPG